MKISSYVVQLLSSYALVILLVPLAAYLARKLNALDYPGYRKIHTTPLPRLGGLAVFGAASGSILLGFALNQYMRAEMVSLRGMFIGGAIILALGITDDIWSLSPLLKLPVQILAATVTVLLGVRFQLASNPLAADIRNYFDLGLLGIPLTIVWIVGLTNAMNLMDGLDGLATGISLLASITLFLISIQQGAGINSYVYVSLAGATSAFLRYNRFPAKMFLGDSGSTFLGFAFACLSVQGTQKSYTLTALFIPIIVFGIPIFEAILTLIRRRLANVGLLQGDKQHVHHLLLSSGLTQRQTVMILYGVTVVLCIIGFTFTALLDAYAAIILLVIGILASILVRELDVFGTRKHAKERELLASNHRQDI